MEINHPESVEDIEQPYLQFIRPSFIMFQTRIAENIKQPMISKKINLQPCLDLQVAESGSHYEEEDIQRYFYLQQEVFPYSFIDPFVDYMDSLRSSNLKWFLSNGGWIFPSFEMNFHIPWSPL